MPRGMRKEVTYTGKAAKVYEKVQKLDAELKAAKAELKAAYKEQLKEEKEAVKKEKAENKEKVLKAFDASGKSLEEIIEFLNS